MPKVHRFSVRPEIPPRLSGLHELALNLRWSWNPRAYRVFQELDADMLERCGGNPFRLLQRTSRERLDNAASDRSYVKRLDDAVGDLQDYLTEPGWFRKQHPEHADLQIAYFCMEYGLSACLPLYAGGLGVLAGDHLKAASGLDLPLAAVGLLYGRGYFTQRLDEKGWQFEEYVSHDFSTLPIRPVSTGETWVRTGSGGRGGESDDSAAAKAGGPACEPGADQLKISVDMAGHKVWARVWEAQVGRVSLYLLDSDMAENDDFARRITGTLYGGGREERLAQELLLGVGGMRALRALGVRPDVCHLNEGHSVFSTLERIREIMQEQGLTYHEARQATGGGTLFTTHTPVSAGFDVFEEELIESYMGPYLKEVGLDTARFMDMGRVHRNMPDEDFNVAVLALRQAPRRNAVSRLHRRTTARMMEPGWADFPTIEVPIESVTNGVHTLSWAAPEMAHLYDRYLGRGWRKDVSDPDVWKHVDRIPDEELWKVRGVLRGRLVAFARSHARARAEGLRAAAALRSVSGTPLKPDTLTIGFARRFATYKRATLFLSDIARLKAILLDEERPVQMIIAGKAHPNDGAGKDFIREVLETVRDEGLGEHVVFIEDHDLRKAALMVQGADVWLNTPRRPFEASGTSGMKVAMNGGLNFSVLDGWWVEGYRPGLGWAIGDGQEFVHADYQDAVDSESLYSTLENEVVPRFYDRDDDGLPKEWVAMMKRSIEVLAPTFSGERMVKQYAERFYVPAGNRYRMLSAEGFARAKEVNAWKFSTREAWENVKVTWVDEKCAPEVAAGEEVEVAAKVKLGTLKPSEVVVEAYCGLVRPKGGISTGKGVPLEWEAVADGEHLFRGKVPTRASGEHGYAVRVLPRNEEVLIPNELPLIVWEEG